MEKINKIKKQTVESGAEAFNCHQAPTVTICELNQLLFIYVNLLCLFRDAQYLSQNWQKRVANTGVLMAEKIKIGIVLTIGVASV